VSANLQTTGTKNTEVTKTPSERHITMVLGDSQVVKYAANTRKKGGGGASKEG